MSDDRVVEEDDAKSSNSVETVGLNINDTQLDRILVVQTINPDSYEETTEEIEIELPLEFEKLISVDTSHIAKICRTCLCEKTEMHSMFDTWDVETLGEMLASFACIQLSFGDGLPFNLCRDCVELVGKCYTFKQLCERSESMLRLLINQGHLQSQVVKENTEGTEVNQISEIKRHNEKIDFQNVDAHKKNTPEEKSCREEVENDKRDDNQIYENAEDNKKTFADRQTFINNKIACLSTVSNPPIDIDPSEMTAPLKTKKGKLENGKTQKCKDKSINNDVTFNYLDEEKYDFFVDVKMEAEEMIDDSNHSINDQILEVSSENIHQCASCGKSYSSQKKLSRHEKTHLDIKPFRCAVCDKGFIESGDLKKHERNHKRKRETYSVLQLVEKDMEVLDLRIPCPHCHLTFSNTGDLHIHLAVHVEQGGKKTCHHCKKQFKTTFQLKRHVRTHLADKPYKCRICHKGFPEMGSLTRHFRSHTGETREKKHNCKHCDKAYHDRHSLNIHMRKHTGERPWVCSVCNKGFIDSRLLNSHMKIHSDNKPFACKICDKKFKHESTLTTHIRVHTGEKPYVCTVCGNAFVQSSNLSLHMRTHTQERPYSCDQCPKKFSSSSALTTHRRSHSGEKPYSCDICQKKFTRHDLSAHMRRHSGEKPHKCSICAKNFTTIGQLNQHTRIHTGEKPFICQICHKGCATSSYLKKHMLRAHNTTGIWHLPQEDTKEVVDKFKTEMKTEIKVAEDLKNVISKKEDKIIEPKTRLIESQIAPLSQSDATLSNFSSNMLNVVALAASSGDVSILNQKNNLNISTLKAQTGDNINAIVTNADEKLFQLDPSYFRIHHIANVDSGHLAITELESGSQES